MKKIFILFLLITMSLSAFAQEKPLLTVLDFVGSGVSEQERQVLVDFISSHIVSSGKYRVIDRMQREAVLKELEFSYSGCTDTSCQLEVGKLLQAEQIIVGSLGKVGSLYILNMKLIDVETGETIHTGSRQYGSMEDLINNSRALTLAFISREELPETAVSVSGGGDTATAEPTETEPSGTQLSAMAIKARNEKQKDLDELVARFDRELFAAWIEENGYGEIFAGENLDDKMFLAKEYYNETRQKWSLDVGVLTRLFSLWHYTEDFDFKFSIGVSIDITYQFTETFGINYGVAPTFYWTTYSRRNWVYDGPDEYYIRDSTFFIPFDMNMGFIFGRKDRFAFTLGAFGNPLVAWEKYSEVPADTPFSFLAVEESGWYAHDAHVGPFIGIFVRDFFIKLRCSFMGYQYITDSAPAFHLNAGYSFKL